MRLQPQSGAAEPAQRVTGVPALRSDGRTGGAALLAVFCAFMVLFAATLRVAHSHSPAEQESGHCQICLAIHAAAPAATAAVQVILHAAPEAVSVPEHKAPTKPSFSILSDRAPPALA